jgi:hypothetical protein
MFALLLGARYPWLVWTPEQLQAELRQRLAQAQQVQLGEQIHPPERNTLALLDELDRLWALEQWPRSEAAALLAAIGQLADKLGEHQGLQPLAGLMLDRIGADGPPLLDAVAALAQQENADQAVALTQFFARRRGQLADARARYAAWWYYGATLAKGAQRICVGK